MILFDEHVCYKSVSQLSIIKSECNGTNAVLLFIAESKLEHRIFRLGGLDGCCYFRLYFSFREKYYVINCIKIFMIKMNIFFTKQ